MCIYIYNCYILLMNLPLYYYIMIFLSPIIVFDLKSVLCDTNMYIPALFGFHLYGISFCIFHFRPVYSSIPKMSLF